LTPVGASPDSSIFYQQTVGSIRSDFGLIDCTVKDVEFYNCGGIYDFGNMTQFFQNGNVRTPGPQGCVYSNIKMRNPKGKYQITAPAIGVSGTTYPHRTGLDVYTYPVEIFVFGGTGVTLELQRAGAGPFTALPLGPYGTAVIHLGDVVKLNYTAAPTFWLWYLAPNIDYDAILLLGGSIVGHTGVATDNIITDCDIDSPGVACIGLVDANNTIIVNNRLANPGAVSASRTIRVGQAFNQIGCGSSFNKIRNNVAEDTRPLVTMTGLFIDDGNTRSTNNRITDNEIGAISGTAGIASSVETNYVKGNKGAGAPNGTLTAPAVSASTVELPNPFNFECFVFFAGGTVTAIASGPAGATVATGLTSGMVPVRHGEVIRLTYSAAPTWVWKGDV
jgi:hypothetical protein